MSNVTKKSERRYMQYIAALSAALSSASSSAYFVWSSPTLPLLLSENSPLGKPITNVEASWLVSSVILATCVGAAIGGWLTERIGRRPPLLISSILMFAPWIAIIFAKSINVLFVARTVGGIGSGVSIIACSIYNAEIADKDIRGKLGIIFVGVRASAGLLILAVGPYVSYTALAIICALFPVVFFCSFVFMPESPYYLTKINDIDGAKKSLETLSANSAHDKALDEMLGEIRETVRNDMLNKTTPLQFLSEKRYRKSIIIMAGVEALHQFSGHSAIEAYMQLIIGDTNSAISPQVSSIIFGIAQLLGVFAASFLVDKLGRKPLLVLSALGCGMALCGEGAYFYIQDITANSTEGIKWLPTTGIAIFMIMSAIGIVSVPYVLRGELFPTNIKGIAVSITTMYTTILGFAVTKSFDPLSGFLGLYGMFWLFAANCILGAIFVLLLLPETKGETFADIQDKVSSSKQKGYYNFVI